MLHNISELIMLLNRIDEYISLEQSNIAIAAKIKSPKTLNLEYISEPIMMNSMALVVLTCTWSLLTMKIHTENQNFMTQT